ncbi:MAG: hypothetical protein M3N68_12150 [Actinomycetota bacterium]|nr:hypothetical protein [Actinomycetota bacterium]
MASDGGWRSEGVLAWTEREGPGRAPAGPHRMLCIGLAATLAVVFVGMMGSDALCPEHRAWVEGLAGLALLGTLSAIVGLVRGWSSAPLVTLLTALAGVAIGFLDAVHDPTRGRLIALVFGLVTVLACWLAVRELRLRRWDRSVLADVQVPLPDGTAAGADAVGGTAEEPARPAGGHESTLPTW